MSVNPMTDQSPDEKQGFNAPKAVKKTSRERGFSPIWIIPIVAVLIGLFLVYRVITESGPTITVSFKEGTGLEAGKTKIKFKDVIVGNVSAVELKKDMSGVMVTIEMGRAASAYMTDKTQFWVVRPRISAGSISGLGTLLSGAYIGIDPSTEGKREKRFVGLERPPLVESDEPGTSYKLKSDKLGGLDFGTPIYYKQIAVGQIVNYELEGNGTITLDIFVKEPYDKHINQATRFWDASGIDVRLSADGVEVHTESMIAVISGGIGFATASGLGLDSSGVADGGQVFTLYENERESRRRKYTEKSQWLLYFEDPIRGLRVGAPVELRGYKIGEVVDIQFVFDQESAEFKIPVLIEIEPERVKVVGETTDDEKTTALLVRKGLRAQLKTGNLILGQLLVDLDFHPDAPPGKIDYSGTVPVMPTIKGALGVIIDDARALVAELREAGETLNKLLGSQEFKSGVEDISSMLGHIDSISAQLDAEAAPEIAAVLTEVAATLKEARIMFAQESTTRNEINQLLIELGDAARSIRQLADYLEQNPESLIRGKD
jgi:paraquat-inducible protein B